MDELGATFGLYSSGPRLAWLWIIEYLSSFPQIDTSIIRGLIETAPVLPDDLGEKTSEMVALRCLEELFGPQNSHGNVAPPDSRVVFDLSLSCEDVLDHILQEIPFSNLKKAGPELLRWDAQPFIRHKRASLPKCELEQLKASILEQIPVLDGDENGPTSRFNDGDDENGNNQEGNLIPQITENDNELLQDGLLERNFLPSKRFRNDLVAGNLVGLFNVNQDNKHSDFYLNEKTFKQDATCTIQSVEDESGMLIKVTEIGHNSGKDSQAGEGDRDVHVLSRTLEQNNAVSHLELQERRMENAQNADADVMVEQKNVDRHCQNVAMDESNYVENDARQKGSSGDAGENIDQGFLLSSPNSTSADGLQQYIDPGQAKVGLEHPCADQICENEDARFNTALNKSLFLSSQCRPSQDPVGQAGWTEQNFCVKCKQYGQVLVCSSSGCPLVVCKSCFGSAARFDDKDNFYCPFCAYSLSTSEYLEAKDDTSLARKQLAAFMELCSKKLTEEQRKLLSHSRLNDNEELVGIQESGHLGEREHNFISQNKEVNHEPSASCLNGNTLCVEEETSTCGAVDVQGENNEEEEKLVFGDRSMGELKLEELPANLNSNHDNPTSENNETACTNQVEVEGNIVREAVEPQIIDPPEKTLCALQTDEEESSTDANDKFIVSSYSIRPRRREPKYSFPPAPKLRRNKVPWTNDEEEILRKGVQKFGNYGGTVPWKRILDFGSKTFMKGRTTVDLKDKWRNMCKGSPKRKSGDVRAQ